MSTQAQTDPPIVSNTNAGIRIKHREYVGEVYASTSTDKFQLVSYPINPGQSKTFPWLSSVADAFQEYKFHGCVFEFISNCADISATSSVSIGSVVLATDYNAAHADYQNKMEMENSEFATSGKPTVNILHLIETAKSQTVTQGHRYVRTGVPESGTDIRLYDLGKFQIASVDNNQNPGTALGSLHVSYDVEFFKPELPKPCEGFAHWYGANAASGVVFGAAPVELYNNIGVKLDVPNERVVFPEGVGGKFQITWNGHTGLAVAAPSMASFWSPSAGISALNLFAGGTSNINGGPNAGVSSQEFVFSATYDVNPSVEDYVTLSFPGLTVRAIDVTVQLLASDVA